MGETRKKKGARRGRPPLPEDQKMALITLKIPPALRDELDEHAKRLSRPRADLIREAIRYWLDAPE